MELVQIHTPLMFDYPDIDALFTRASERCKIDPECYGRAKDDFKWLADHPLYQVWIGRNKEDGPWQACAIIMLPGCKLFQPQLFMFHCEGDLPLRRAIAAKCVEFVAKNGYNKIQTAIGLDTTPEIVTKAGGVKCRAVGRLVEFQL